MKLYKIRSQKHPGAIFFKVAGTKADFICKFYPGKEEEAHIFEQAMDKVEPISLQMKLIEQNQYE